MNAKSLLLFVALLILAPLNSLRAADSAVEIQRGRVFVERESGSLAADVYIPRGKGPYPGILVVHGGAWKFGNRTELAAAANALAEHDYTAVAIDYRLAPKYKFPAQIHDCQAAVRWMRTNAGDLKINPKRIGGFGYSAGGHLVALLGTLDDKQLREEGIRADAPSARLQVVVAGGAPCDFRILPPGNHLLSYWLGGSKSEKPDAYRDASPASFITADDPPMYFFHGQQDLLVPAASPMAMVGLLKAAGVTGEMFAIKNAGHLEALFDRKAIEQGLTFADKYLKAKDAAPAPAPPASGASDGQ